MWMGLWVQFVVLILYSLFEDLLWGFFGLFFFSIQQFYLPLKVNTSPALHSQPWVRTLCFISPSEKTWLAFGVHTWRKPLCGLCLKSESWDFFFSIFLIAWFHLLSRSVSCLFPSLKGVLLVHRTILCEPEGSGDCRWCHCERERVTTFYSFSRCPNDPTLVLSELDLEFRPPHNVKCKSPCNSRHRLRQTDKTRHMTHRSFIRCALALQYRVLEQAHLNWIQVG